MANNWNTVEADYLYKTSTSVFSGTAVTTFLIYYNLRHTTLQYVEIWFLLLSLINIFCFLTIQLVHRKIIYKSMTKKKLVNIYWSLLALGWGLWAFASIFYFPKLDAETVVFYSIVICGISSACIPVYLNSSKIMVSSIICFLVPFALGSFISSNTFSTSLAVISLIYMYVLLKSGKTQFKSAYNEYTYYEKNNYLVEELKNKSNEIIDNAKSNILIDMASGMAHEINNPLTTIMLQVDLLEIQINKFTSSSDKLHRIVNSLRDNTNRIQDITKHLSYFFQTSSHDQRKKNNLREIINQSIAFYNDTFSKEKISVYVDLDINEEMVYCNKDEIAQALKHMLTNAIEACLKQQSQRWISITASLDNHQFKITISDCGSGIEVELQDKIMNPFFTTKEIGSGLGLGLSISNSVIRKHSGTIKIDTTVENTTFIINLPIIKEKNEN